MTTEEEDPYAQIMADFNNAVARSQNVGATSLPPSSAASPGEDDWLNFPVSLGKSRPDPRASRFQGKMMPDGPLDVRSVPVVTTVGDAYDEWHRKSLAEQRELAKKLEDLGLVEPGNYTYADLERIWMDTVDQAANIRRATGRDVSPEGVLNLTRQLRGPSAADGFDKRDVSTGTQTQVNLTTKAQARAAIRSAFQAELGRDPSRKETRAFYRALHAAEKRNPTTTESRSVTTRQRDGNSDTDTTSTTSGGVGTEFAANYMDDRYDAEKDARNSATIYYDALLSLAGGGS